MPSDTAVWQVATYGILFTAVLVIIGCGIAFVQAIWSADRARPSDRRGSRSDLGRVPLTAARRANFLDSESRRQD